VALAELHRDRTGRHAAVVAQNGAQLQRLALHPRLQRTWLERQHRIDVVLAAQPVGVLRHAGRRVARKEAHAGQFGSDGPEVPDLAEHVLAGRNHRRLLFFLVFDHVDSQPRNHPVQAAHLPRTPHVGVDLAQVVAAVVEVDLGYEQVHGVAHLPPVVVYAHVPQRSAARGVSLLVGTHRRDDLPAGFVVRADLVNGDPGRVGVRPGELLDRPFLVAHAAFPGAGQGAAPEPPIPFLGLDRGWHVAPLEVPRRSEPQEHERAVRDRHVLLDPRPRCRRVGTDGAEGQTMPAVRLRGPLERHVLVLAGGQFQVNRLFRNRMLCYLKRNTKTSCQRSVRRSAQTHRVSHRSADARNTCRSANVVACQRGSSRSQTAGHCQAPEEKQAVHVGHPLRTCPSGRSFRVSADTCPDCQTSRHRRP